MIWPTMGTTESTSLWEVGVRGVEKPLRAVSGLAWAKIGLPTRCATCCATRCSLCCARCTCCKWPKLSLHHSLLRNHSLDETLDKLTSFFAADNVSAKTSRDPRTSSHRGGRRPSVSRRTSAVSNTPSRDRRRRWAGSLSSSIETLRRSSCSCRGPLPLGLRATRRARLDDGCAGCPCPSQPPERFEVQVAQEAADEHTL